MYTRCNRYLFSKEIHDDEKSTKNSDFSKCCRFFSTEPSLPKYVGSSSILLERFLHCLACGFGTIEKIDCCFHHSRWGRNLDPLLQVLPIRFLLGKKENYGRDKRLVLLPDPTRHHSFRVYKFAKQHSIDLLPYEQLTIVKTPLECSKPSIRIHPSVLGERQ